MRKSSARSTATFCGISGILGVLMLAVSFTINVGPQPNDTVEQLTIFANNNYQSILLGAWLQAVGPVFLVLFAFGLVHFSKSAGTIASYMTFFGATVLMMVSMIEITFYIAVLFKEPAVNGLIDLNIIYAVQHLYFMVATPAFFIPLGIVIIRSAILPVIFGYTAVALGLVFAFLGIIFLFQLVLPMIITALGGFQALWWLAASVSLIGRTGKISPQE